MKSKSNSSKLKTIPKFKTVKEEAEFWDTHDVTDYFLDLKQVDVEFKPKHPKKAIIVIRVQSGLKRKLEQVAMNEGLVLSTLIRKWFIEKIKSKN